LPARSLTIATAPGIRGSPETAFNRMASAAMANSASRRKMKMSWGETREFLTAVRGVLSVHPFTAETHETGLALAERYRFALYDAMIVAAALIAGCGTLLSEGMTHGLSIEGRLRIINPFAEAA
jgi:predicted nucleic acid-binding protein